jgi:muramoyltetrapeptide carboxypeptidase
MNTYPQALKKGDKIAIVSPAGIINPDYIIGASNRLREWGLEAIIGKNAQNVYGRFAGTCEERIADLQWAMDNSEIKAILCSRGGYGTVQIIDKINFSSFKKNPKWLIGFSDITILHAALSEMGIPSIHGIMAKHLTESNPNSISVQSLHDILFGNKPTYKIAPHQLNRKGCCDGILIGGNLSVLFSLRGTKYDINPKEKILFLEDLAEKPYHIDRMMRNLKTGDILENLSGLIIGQFTEIEEDKSMLKTVYEIILDAVADYDYPVCFNFPAGHTDENLPLILGAEIELKISDESAIIEWK